MRAIGVASLGGRIYVATAADVEPTTIIRSFGAQIDTLYAHRNIIRLPEEEKHLLQRYMQRKEELTSNFPVGAWVKVKQGMFKGDIGRVRESVEGTDVLAIEVIPRIRALGRKRSREGSRAGRPGKALVPAAELENCGKYWRLMDGERIQGREVEMGNGELYTEKGLRILTVTGLHFVHRYHPNAEEIQAFTEAGIDTEAETNAMFARRGCKVTLRKGAMRGKTGTVDAIDGDEVRVKLGGERDLCGTGIVGCGLADLKRVFEEGGSVRIRIGGLKGRCGMIIAVTEEELVIVDHDDKSQVRRTHRKKKAC